MADKPTEQEKASLSQERGKTAAALQKQGHFASPQDTQKFISAQGDAEAAGKLDKPKMDQLSSQGRMSFHTGGDVESDGEYKLRKGEIVIPAGEGSSYSRLRQLRKSGKIKK